MSKDLRLFPTHTELIYMFPLFPLPSSSQNFGVTTNTTCCDQSWTLERHADVVSALGCVTVTLTTAERQLWTNCLLLPLVITTAVIILTATLVW